MELALTAVAKAEGLEVSDEEYEAEITKLSEQYNMPVEQVKAVVAQEALKQDMLLRKASRVVLDSAKAGKAKKTAKKAEEGEAKPKRTRAKKTEE